MKIESIRKIPRLLWAWYRENGPKKTAKYAIFYSLYVGIVILFDYCYMPWLAIKFQYFAIIPLFVSLFLISWLGLWLYRTFDEDLLFLEKINSWLEVKESGSVGSFIKSKIRGNPKKIFIATSIWWSPVHAYLFFKRDKDDYFIEAAKAFLAGSFYCALFWGLVIDLIILIWQYVHLWDAAIVIFIAVIVRKLMESKVADEQLMLKGGMQ